MCKCGERNIERRTVTRKFVQSFAAMGGGLLSPLVLLAFLAQLGAAMQMPPGVAYCNASEALVDNSGMGYKVGRAAA